MKKESIGYKVVRLALPLGDNGKRALLSAAVHDRGWVVAYTPKFPTYGRQGTPLFAFDSLPHANRFVRARPHRNAEVWKARLCRPRPRKRLASWVHNYLRFWSGIRRDTFQAPAGTLVCESITLLEKVK